MPSGVDNAAIVQGYLDRVTVTVHLISGFYASTSLLIHLSLCLIS